LPFIISQKAKQINHPQKLKKKLIYILYENSFKNLLPNSEMIFPLVQFNVLDILLHVNYYYFSFVKHTISVIFGSELLENKI